MLQSAAPPKRAVIESDISPQAYARIVDLSRQHAGIVLTDSKAPMVKSRLTRRLRALGLSTIRRLYGFSRNGKRPAGNE